MFDHDPGASSCNVVPPRTPSLRSAGLRHAPARRAWGAVKPQGEVNTGNELLRSGRAESQHQLHSSGKDARADKADKISTTVREPAFNLSEQCARLVPAANPSTDRAALGEGGRQRRSQSFP